MEPMHQTKKEAPAKILPVEPPKVEYEFTCARCGAHLGTDSVASTAKFSGFGLGFSRIRVCRVCGFSKEYTF